MEEGELQVGNGLLCFNIWACGLRVEDGGILVDEVDVIRHSTRMHA
jgi:hypothetical protein